MNVVAIGMAKNEADVVQEGVREGLRWADDFVVYESGSTDGTADLAEDAGAIVIRGEPEPFNEGLRQHTLEAALSLDPDWIWRIDVDEIYHPEPEPRELLAAALEADVYCVRAMQAEFWLTLDDVRRGLLLEDESISVQERRRWYTFGHTAMVAWRPDPRLAYRMDEGVQKGRNVPTTADGRDVSGMGPCYPERLLQKHYNCRSMHQVIRRMRDRVKNLALFGKYKYNLIIDESVGLHYLGPDERFDTRDNHGVVYEWYARSQKLFEERMGE